MTSVTLIAGTQWTVPANVKSIRVTCIGGGGGGSGGITVLYEGVHNNYGGGGGYAAIPRTTTLAVTPGSTIVYSIGDGGLGGQGWLSWSPESTFMGKAGGTTTFTGAVQSRGGLSPTTIYGSTQPLPPRTGRPGEDSAIPGISASPGLGTQHGDGGAGYGSGGGGGDGYNGDFGAGGGKGAQGCIIIEYGMTPVASFGAVVLDGTGKAPATAHFTNTSSADSVAFDWDFGDGSPHSTETNPVHIYVSGGVYTACLIAIGGVGNPSSKYCRSVTVGTDPPVASFTGSPTSGNIPLTVQFTDASTLASAWHWDFGDGGTSTSKSPQHIYTGIAAHTVTLTVTNVSGSNTQTRVAYINTQTVPTAAFVVRQKEVFQLAPFCPDGCKVKLYDKSNYGGSDPASWLWTLTATNKVTQTSTEQNPEIALPVEAGLDHVYWTVSLVVTNSLGISSATATIPNAIIQRVTYPSVAIPPVVNPPVYYAPVANFVASSTAVYTGISVNFSDLSTYTPTSWSWTFGDGSSSTSKNPVHTYTNAGTYTVILTATNAYGSDSETKTGYIVVTQAPSAPTSDFVANTTTITVGQSVTFTYTGSGATYWLWSTDGTNYNSTPLSYFTHQFNTAGMYSVQLYVNNPYGTDTELKTNYITVNAVPVSDYGYVTPYLGNPVGGNTGYSDIKLTGDYVATSEATLRTYLSTSAPGKVVWVASTTTIDLTGLTPIPINPGVILASDRGASGHTGALIRKTRPHVTGGWESGSPMFTVTGVGTRITGIRLQGESYTQDSWGTYPLNEQTSNESSFMTGIYINAGTNIQVDNCEIWGFAYANVYCRDSANTWVHHNYIRNSPNRGEGYGVNPRGGTTLIEGNIFDYLRHDVSGEGRTGEQYEVRYNHFLGHGMPIGSNHLDVHQDEAGGSFAGSTYRIHHNTVEDNGGGTQQMAFVHMRHIPTVGCYVNNNDVKTTAFDNVSMPVYQTNAYGNIFCTVNKWKNIEFSGNTGFYQQV
jgi:PKD repeat protein